jgi:hypothetical protein
VFESVFAWTRQLWQGPGAGSARRAKTSGRFYLNGRRLGNAAAQNLPRDNQKGQGDLFDCEVAVAQGCAIAGREASASLRNTSKSTHLRQWFESDNQKGQDDLFDCEVNSTMRAVSEPLLGCLRALRGG